MNVRLALAGLLLLLASSGCRAPQPETRDFSTAQPGKEVCERDSDCAWMFTCTGERRCTCQVDADCAATQHCVATSAGRGGVCRFK